MLQLKNSTPFAANMALFPNQDGVDTLYLIVKASFQIGQQWTLTEEQTPPIEADEYWGEPNKSSIKYASDFHIGKPATDIVMLGNACSPNNEAVNQLDVSLAVGQVNKTIKVFGDRQWQDGRITSPKPFQSMPLVYERAYGGSYIDESQAETVEERNPVGRGYAGKRSASDMNGQPLPNLENPANLIQQYTDQPEPSCFALSAASWQPRRSYVGTYDEAWQTQRAPYLPVDFDKRFFNMAHKDLIYPGYLQGGEPVQITNMHQGGNLQFNLPQVKLASRITIGNSEERPLFNIETLTLEPNKLQLSMVWRAAIPCDKKALKIKQVDIALAR